MTWHPALSAHWFAVARADELGSRPLAIDLLDIHAALARTPDGRLVALEDRCPHRHAPLSAGRTTRHGIRCPYHGWSFDADGRLREIPGTPAGCPLPAVRARCFATREHDGLVWMRPGASGLDRPNSLALGTDPATRRFLWRTRWPANVVDAMENFLDPLHTHAVHPGLVRRGAPSAETTAEFRGTGDGFLVDYPGLPTQSGLLFRLFESKRTVERAHFAAPGSARIEYGYANGSRVTIDLHFSPASQTETNVFAVLHVTGRRAPAWAVRLLVWPLLRRVNAQDVGILALQAANRRRYGPRREVSTERDLARSALEHFWRTGELPDAAARRSVRMLL